MAFTSWLQRLKGRRGPHHGTTTRAAGRRPFVPRLDVLEDRTVPSTFTVTNLSDSGTGSLRAALTAANTAPGADVIKFKAGLTGTIPLASELSVTDDLTIDGPGARTVTVSGNHAVRVFHVSGSATDLAIEGLTVANGLAAVAGGAAFGGGLLNAGASVRLAGVGFAGNQAGDGTAYAGGGAVANLGGAHLTAEQTDFRGNTARGASDNFGNGGAVYDDQHAVVAIAQGRFA